MKRKFSLYHFLIAIMMFSLVLPGFAGATAGNDGEKGSLTIYKFEQEPGATQGNPDGSKLADDPEGKALPGVEYTLTQTHAYHPETDEWTEVNGTTPIIQTTDENGKIVIDNIPLGRYKVQETAWPDHVNGNTNEYFVDIPMTDPNGEFVNYDVHIYPKNETIRGAVELTKVDGDNTEKALKGVKFKLYNSDDSPATDKDGNELPYFFTNDQGKIIVENLAYGDYYFKEVATIDGYVLGDQRVEFEIRESGTTVPVDIENYKEPDIEKDVDESDVNRGEIVTYTLTIDLPGDIDKYTQFVVTDVLDSNLEYAGNEQSPEGFTFDQSGQTLTWTVSDFSKLSKGKVTISFDAKVKEDAEVEVINNKAKINYTNEHDHSGEKETDDTPLNPTDGGVKVIKVDASDDNKRLEGAEFKLTDADGNTINAAGTVIKVNGVAHTGLLEGLKTDSNGEFTITGLKVGTYYLHETKAPTYEQDGEAKSYRLLTSPVKVDIEKDQTKEVTVKNSKSGWTLPKTGGIGTVLFTLVGLTLMGASLFLFIRRRRGEVA